MPAGARFTMAEADREVMADPAARRRNAEVTVEAFRQGPAAHVRAAAQLAEPWACWLKEVQPKVTILQGSCDRITPPAMAQHLAEALPNAAISFFPGEGHVSLPQKYSSEILAAALPAK